MKHLLKLGTRMYRKGEIIRSEALSQGNYQNAILFLLDQRTISAKDLPEKKDRKDARIYTLLDDKQALDALRKRIFRYM